MSNDDEISRDLSALVANINLHTTTSCLESAPELSAANSIHTSIMDNPPIDKQVLGISDTSCSAELQVKANLILPPVIYSLPNLAVLATVARYTAAPGSSTLKLVRYWQKSSQGLVYRLSLNNEADLHLFEAAPVFELDSDQFDLLLACGKHIEWLRLLRGLVYRTSYRAVYHVRKQLTRFYGNNGPVFEEQAWTTGWATEMGKRPVNDKEVL
ncbi:hypothetical protein LTR78_007162 [Recurvomyces mirabilis]|uniref:Uncharacterized protein n=1 Tax=Recurvomyces mirabilis TaxID=574656 RepID=A0AAE1BYX0_9PEZI|nr:hypothetical protein LTR78_007162 [Recurvomyces mirabilis]KAK5150866.1 hypothetical protein LTS14_009669 [Recurvomyces mirabilis]